MKTEVLLKYYSSLLSLVIKPRSRRLGGFLLCTWFIKPRSHRLGGFLLCTRFIFLFKPRSRRLGGFFLCARFIFFLKPRSRRLVGFLLCTRFIIFFFSFVGEQTQTPTHGQLSSPDDVIISQLQAISQHFSSYPPLRRVLSS